MMGKWCPHIVHSVQYSDEELVQLREFARCVDCNFMGKNLWLCLAVDCARVMCGDSQYNHSSSHFNTCLNHMVHQNLSTQRIWCYNCYQETFYPPKTVTNEENDLDDDENEHEELTVDLRKPKGLQNIGNTCYMNAALQALCSLPPLVHHFLRAFPPPATLPSAEGQRKLSLSRSFHRLVTDMTESATDSTGSKPQYFVPTGILYAIRATHPMFRGYQQHDTQEFLRCLMDQLHEELKEPVVEVLPNRFPIAKTEDDNETDNGEGEINDDEDDDDEDEEEGGVGTGGGASSGSQSEAEYETCDSGVSERSSLSDEQERESIKRKHSISSSSPPPSRCINNISSKSISRPISTKYQQQLSPGKIKRKPLKYRSVISDIFDGKLLSSVECLTCNKVSTRVETFQDLSLPIPSRDHVNMLHQGAIIPPQPVPSCNDVHKGKSTWVSWLWEWMKSWFWGPTVSLHDCLAAFFSADELKGDNMYSCEKCSKLRNGVKLSKVLELPEILCIHLKRFRHELAFSSKINSFVSFPLTELDMRPYLHKDCKNEVTSYELNSVICHYGTAGGGHYTCYALSPYSRQWYLLDDQCVTPVSAETVANVEGYVLFYRKSQDRVSKVRTRVLELIKSSSERSLMSFYASSLWLMRLQTFAEPGPIDNCDFLCPHGDVHPVKVPIVNQLASVLSADVWEFLHNEYGGGPVCNRLYLCGICQDEQAMLLNRMDYELKQYMMLHKEFERDENPSSGMVYALSMQWFRQWRSFVQAVTAEPPGPIDNSAIAVTSSSSSELLLRPGSDYGQISAELWNFFRDIYGGGPELIVKQIPLATRSSTLHRASLSSGISLERLSCSSSTSSDSHHYRQQQCRSARSTESLSAGGGGDIGVSSRTHSASVSSDTAAHLKVVAANAIANRKLSHSSGENTGCIRASSYSRVEHVGQGDSRSIKDSRDEEFEENNYCPAFTPDELDSYSPFNHIKTTAAS